MNKRIKSFLIDTSSIFGTGLVAVLVAIAASPEWASVADLLASKAVASGVAPSVVVLVGKVISEIWKQILNNITLKEAGLLGYSGSKVRSELY